MCRKRCDHTLKIHGTLQVNPLAYWTFEDCFDYIAKYKIPIHPLHAQGYPSIGDAKDTVKVRGA
jgi:3'-phosphoadenosine 5'-phosphosulfate sulfotransferase (PAPS reductase)/FAD synthetase